MQTIEVFNYTMFMFKDFYALIVTSMACKTSITDLIIIPLGRYVDGRQLTWFPLKKIQPTLSSLLL